MSRHFQTIVEEDINGRKAIKLKMGCIGCIGYMAVGIILVGVVLGVAVRVFNFISGG